MKPFLYVSAILSALMLLMSIYGQFQTLPMVTPKAGESFEPSLMSSVYSLDTLQSEAERRADATFASMNDRDKMDVLFRTVTARFAHGWNQHSILSNWILWLGGHLIHSTGYIRDPDTLLRISSHALCSQQSYVLLRIAERNGISTRQVGLNGHVVMEAWYDDAWHMYDPDYEVVPKNDEGRVLSVAELEQSANAVITAYGPQDGVGLAKVYMSTQDNTFTDSSQGTYFSWKAQVLLYVEMATEWLKFIIPLGVMLGSVALIRRRT